MPLNWDYKNFTAFDALKNCTLVKKLEKLLPDYINKSNDPEKPILSLPAKKDDLAEINEHAQRISSKSDDVLVLGVGGSSLGGQALIQACGTYNDNRPNITFPDNLSPLGFPYLISKLNPKKTHIIAISKSGLTLELHAQLAINMEWLKNEKCCYKDHITVITDPKASPLRKLVNKHNLPSLEHIDSLGGRFSVLSNVGLLPAAVAGINILEVRKGAQEIIDEMKAAKGPVDIPSAIGAAHIIAQQQQNNINISVYFLYADRLRKFGEWYCQLWAESIGKNGVGTTPVIAQGPLDQHSQLQLYMEGPRDKSYSFITIEREDSTKVELPELLDDIGMGHLTGLSLHNIVTAMSKGTHHALSDTNQPVRHLHLENLNERNLGKLFMYFFLETKFASALLGVNFYGQPGVEKGKVITKGFLGK